MRLFWTLAALIWACGTAGATQWRETVSPHFVIAHESPWTPPGFVIALEKLHNRLRMDLSMFSPWMAKERLRLYLYKERATYLKGEFEPPSWSNGIAMYDKKAVAVHDQPEAAKLLQIIAHETTHLLFEGFWKEAGKQPPSWLNEGLAMMEESESVGKPEKSDWYQAMAYQPRKSLLPLEKFFAINPTTDIKDDQEKVTAWYVQAYSLVYFLYRRHSRLQFKTFCGHLRDGRPLKESLWLSYRFATLAKLESAWREWLDSPEHKKRVEALAQTGARAKVVPSAIPIMDGFRSLRE